MKEYLAGYYCRDTLHLRIVNKESNRKILEALKQSYPVGLDVYELAEKTNLPLKTIYGQKTELYREYYISHYAEETNSTKRGRPKHITTSFCGKTTGQICGMSNRWCLQCLSCVSLTIHLASKMKKETGQVIK